MEEQEQHQMVIDLAREQKYEVKGIKSFRGNEGYGFNATLYRKGKKIAFVMDSAQGGQHDWEWVDRKLRFEETKLICLVKNIPECETEFDFTMGVDIDMFISMLVGEKEEYDSFKRKCKTKTLYTLKSDQPNQYWIMNHIYDERVKAHLQKKHGSELVEIINERYI